MASSAYSKPGPEGGAGAGMPPPKFTTGPLAPGASARTTAVRLLITTGAVPFVGKTSLTTPSRRQLATSAGESTICSGRGGVGKYAQPPSSAAASGIARIFGMVQLFPTPGRRTGALQGSSC